MLRANIRELDGIVFTHEHNDHVLGIDDTRPFSHFSEKPVEIYAWERVLNEIKIRFPYVFAEEKYPGAPSLNMNFIEKENFEVSGIQFQPLEIMHGDLPILGFLIDEKFAYITDASFIPEETMKKIRNVEVLVLNALRKSEKHYSHFTLEEGLEIAEKLNAGKVYFTHISVTMGFHEEVQKELPANAFLAYDGLEIQI
jgi:phosphoribosyl 1,2-cyclic phosphate phosphodiesterase